MMSEGHKMDIVYYDPYPNKKLEEYMKGYGDLLKSHGERPVTCTRVETMEEVFKAGDVHLSSPSPFLFGPQTSRLISRI